MLSSQGRPSPGSSSTDDDADDDDDDDDDARLQVPPPLHRVPEEADRDGGEQL